MIVVESPPETFVNRKRISESKEHIKILREPLRYISL